MFCLCAQGDKFLRSPQGPQRRPPLQLTGSVGTGGRNVPADVKLVQFALNLLSAASGGPLQPLALDGVCGQFTIASITRFQHMHFRGLVGDGRIDPGRRTATRLNHLIGGTPPAITSTSAVTQRAVTASPTTLDQLEAARRFAPDAERRIVDAMSRLTRTQTALATRARSQADEKLIREANWHFKADIAENPLTHFLQIQGVYTFMLTALREFNSGIRELFQPGTHPDANAIAFSSYGGFFSLNPDDRFIYITPAFRTQALGLHRARARPHVGWWRGFRPRNLAPRAGRSAAGRHEGSGGADELCRHASFLRAPERVFVQHVLLPRPCGVQASWPGLGIRAKEFDWRNLHGPAAQIRDETRVCCLMRPERPPSRAAVLPPSAAFASKSSPQTGAGMCRSRTLCAAAWLVASLIAFGAGTARAAFPERAVHVIVPFAPGGATDVVARALAQRLAEHLGPAGGRREQARRRRQHRRRRGRQGAARRLHLLLASPAEIAINPHLYPRMPYDPVKDLAPVDQDRRRAAGARGPSFGAGEDASPSWCSSSRAKPGSSTTRRRARAGRSISRPSVPADDRHRHAARSLQGRRARR